MTVLAQPKADIMLFDDFVGASAVRRTRRSPKQTPRSHRWGSCHTLCAFGPTPQNTFGLLFRTVEPTKDLILNIRLHIPLCCGPMTTRMAGDWVHIKSYRRERFVVELFSKAYGLPAATEVGYDVPPDVIDLPPAAVARTTRCSDQESYC